MSVCLLLAVDFLPLHTVWPDSRVYLKVLPFSSLWIVLSMPCGDIIWPLMVLFVTAMTLTKPVWSSLVPCWCICDQNDRLAEVIACMSSPFSLLIHLWMFRSPVVAGYYGQGLRWLWRTVGLAHSLSLKHQLHSQLEHAASVSQHPIHLTGSLLFQAGASKLHTIVNEVMKHKVVLWKYIEEMTLTIGWSLYIT